MEEFYIEILLNKGMIRIQVQEVAPEQWDMPYTPQFALEYYAGKGFTTLTIRLEQGTWYDRNTRMSEDDFHLRYFELGDDAWNPDYQSPLADTELQEIGNAIASYMVVQLTAYMEFFIPSFRTPTLN